MAKEEVANWPGIGFIAKLNDTMFIARRAADARRQQVEMRARIDAGAHLCFFPEGTSTDSRHIAPFKPALFQVYLSDDLRDTMQIQPVALGWIPPAGQPDIFYGWWGEMGMGDSIWHIACRSSGGRVIVNWRPALNPSAFADRKQLAAAAERSVRDGLAEVGIVAG
jgi:1-acyl-sn-glycerol-3-phosphate acyltransferase